VVLRDPGAAAACVPLGVCYRADLKAVWEKCMALVANDEDAEDGEDDLRVPVGGRHLDEVTGVSGKTAIWRCPIHHRQTLPLSPQASVLQGILSLVRNVAEDVTSQTA
jgi:hypothetical protein